MIDENRIKKNLEIFSFPRLSGTHYEKIAFNIMKEKIKKLKLNPSVQNFSFSIFYSRIYPKICLLLTFWLLFILIIINEFVILILNLIIISIIFTILFLYTRKPERISLGQKLESQNLIVKLPSGLRNSDDSQLYNTKSEHFNNRNIFFLAHLDSKGQKLSINARINSYKIWLFSSLIIVVIYLFNFIIMIQIMVWIQYIGIIFLAVNLFSTIMILINSTNNKSKGAIDNASGIVCLLELINHYLESNPIFQNFNLYFVFTGAEETGTMGIRYFYKSLEKIDKKRSIVLNFDGIGKKVTAFGTRKNLSIYKNLNEVFKQEAYKYDIKLKMNTFYIGVYSDGIYMHRKKKFTGFGFGDEDSYKFIHSVNDTIDKINPFVIKQLCLLIIQFIERLAE